MRNIITGVYRISAKLMSHGSHVAVASIRLDAVPATDAHEACLAVYRQLMLLITIFRNTAQTKERNHTFNATTYEL
jgi:hypothetical protein